MKTRIVHTRFWQDSFIASLPLHEKTLFIYLLTNDRVSISGIYELPDSYIKADLGLTQKQLDDAKSKFTQNNKIIFQNGWIKIVNADKYNSFSGEKLDKAREKELALVPQELIGYRYSIDTSIDTSMHTPNKHKHINNQKEGGVGETKLADPNYLLAIPQADLDELATKFSLTIKSISDKAESLHDWYLSNPKKNKKSDWKATLRNALRKDADELRGKEQSQDRPRIIDVDAILAEKKGKNNG